MGGIDRRGLIAAGGALATGALLAPAAWSAPGTAVVETKFGKVRGYQDGPVSVFKGIAYGDTTAGANRYLPPRPPRAWTGIFAATGFRDRAPQISGGPGSSPKIWNSWGEAEGEGEDCLVLNVWTPGPDNKKRPVMVWWHGGGYGSFSGAASCYVGERLVSRRDVVLVTVNHRLNVLGYLYFGDLGGEQFKHSNNLGQQDLVATLEWVRDNIANFGGDPSNVMIFGESGGGGKVCTALAMPSAKGLFHRAAVQSGPTIAVNTPERAAATRDGVLKALAIAPGEIAKLQSVPVERLMAAMASLGPRGGLGFGPVLDPLTIPAHPFDPVANPLAANVPLIIGYNATETTALFAPDAVFALTWDGLSAALGPALEFGGGKAGDATRLVAGYRKAKPNASPSDVYFEITTERGMGMRSRQIAERKSKQKGGAKAYLYKLNWRTPVDNGRWRSPHSLDIPLIFDTIGNSESIIPTAAASDAQKVSEAMSAAWTNFARTGDPNGAGAPVWEAYSQKTRATMVFDIDSRTQHAPDAVALKVIDA